MGLETVYIQRLKLTDSTFENTPKHYNVVIEFSNGKVLKMRHHLHPKDVLQLMKGTKHKYIELSEKQTETARLLSYECALKKKVEDFFNKFFAQHVDFKVTPKINPVCSNQYIPSCLKELREISVKLNDLERKVNALTLRVTALNDLVTEIKIHTHLQVQEPEKKEEIKIQTQKLLTPFLQEKRETRETCCLMYSKLKKIGEFVCAEEQIARFNRIFDQLDGIDEKFDFLSWD